jgi:hypothetical protein
MLKIRDNINLSELKEFGFDENSQEYSRFFGGDTLIVRKLNRTIYIETHNMWDIAEDCLGLLHDLIKADMVEKVEN